MTVVTVKMLELPVQQVKIILFEPDHMCIAYIILDSLC